MKEAISGQQSAVRVGAVVTTFNEAATIGALVSELGANGFSPVIVVDDQSLDETPHYARMAGADVRETDKRFGIGLSLMAGWLAFLPETFGCEYIVQIDAGGSHDPNEAMGLVAYATATGADVVIGSRFCKGARYTGNPKRALLSRLAALMCNLAQHGAHYSDWTSGYRVFSRKALQTLLSVKHYRGRMHEWQIEVLARAGEAGLRIVEAPITYTAGRSSFNLRVAWEAFQMWGHVFNHIGAVRKATADGRRQTVVEGIHRWNT